MVMREFEPTMNPGRTVVGILAWILFLVVAAGISPYFALLSQTFAYTFHFSTRVWRSPSTRSHPESGRGFEVLAKRMHIELPVDSVLWFAVLSGTGVFVYRRRRRMKSSTDRRSTQSN
jgi:hypothetical protein